MFEIQIQVEEGARLTLVEMAGNVTLAGRDRGDVYIRSEGGREEDFQIVETETGPAVSARVDCEIQVPTTLPLTIRQVAGNLRVKGLAAGLNAEQIRGNLQLSDVDEAIIAEVYGNTKADAVSSLKLVGTMHGDAGLKAVGAGDLQNVRGNLRAKALENLRVSRVGGNLQVKEISGPLDADRVGGNALLKGVAGALTVDQVAGNLVAKDLTGGAKVPRIGGNLTLNGGLGTGCTYHFQADGNATLRLSEEASVHVTLRAKGNLLSSVDLMDRVQDGHTLTGTLGDGGAEIVVEAKGNVMLGGSQAAVGADLGAEISRQVEESLRAIDLEAIGRQVSEEMEAAMSRLRVKLESVEWERIGLQAQHAVERAMDRMQRDMDRMVEKAARHQARLERKAERETRRLERLERKLGTQARGQERPSVEVGAQDWPVEETAEVMEPEPDLDEERLSVLRMVEQGQITPEEAEMLLDALR